MTHNPIVKQSVIGRFEQPTIERNHTGYLYSRGQLYRKLLAGEGLTFGERLKGGYQLYVINDAPHEMRWDLRLPAEGRRDNFSISVNLRYRVDSGKQMIEDDVQDTERLVVRALETPLRKAALQFPLIDFELAEQEFEALITPARLAECGLALMDADVIMAFSDSDLQRIEALQKLARAMRYPQQIEYSAEFPSKEPAFKFHGNVLLNFKVLDPQRLPTDTLDEAADWLWHQVRAKLRRESRHFTVDHLVEVDDAMYAVLEGDIFSDHGLEITSAEIEVDLDEMGYAHAVTLAALRRERMEEQERKLLDEIKQDRDISGQERYLKFYAPLIEKGDWQLLALALAQNEQDINQVLGYLDERRREKLGVQFKLLEIAMQKDGVGEDVMEQLFSSTAYDIARTTDTIRTELPLLETSEDSGHDNNESPVEEGEFSDSDVTATRTKSEDESEDDDAAENTSSDPGM